MNNVVNDRIVNAMSIDVEDYFQVSAFDTVIDRKDWESLECRIEKNTQRVLSMLAEHDVRATFFVLGWIAERYPQLIKDIVRGGHELASHGYSHKRITSLTPAEFKSEIRVSKMLLEDIGGAPVIGYRAPSYSIVKETLWAHDILADEGYLYSSSVYPIRHDIYGIPDAPRFKYNSTVGITEIPVSTTVLFGRNIPCGGGGYFRLFPYSVSKWAIGHVNREDAKPCNFYFHPWELDPDQPRQEGISFKTGFRHYLNLRKMESRLRRLLEDFNWATMESVYLGDAK